MGYSNSKAAQAYKKASLNIGRRSYNNTFNPSYMNYPEECCDALCEEKECPSINLKLFPSDDQFEMIKLYYLNPRVNMNISDMFELTDKQFNELYQIHMKHIGDRDECRTKSQHIYRIRDFYRSFYRDTEDQRKVFIKMLNDLDIDIDTSAHSSDTYDLQHKGYTETQEAWVSLFRILLEFVTGLTEEERNAKREEYYENILIPKFMDLEKRNMVGKRWWLIFEPDFDRFSTAFILKYIKRFSARFLLAKRMQYKEISENSEVKDLIIERLVENIKDELGIYNVNDGLVDVTVNFDLDQVSLFKYLEDMESSKYGEDPCGC